MQGVVFGVKVPGVDWLTRFDYDQYFGTVINRFCAQAISNNPLTIYGSGQQVRGFLPLKDSIQCLQIAIDNPPNKGTYRTFNQFEATYSLNELADLVSLECYNLFSIEVELDYINNPRTEANKHYYNPTREALPSLGYKPTEDIQEEISELLTSIYAFRTLVKDFVLYPTTTWR
jgi:UDP-sulfoquinovose synthase